MPDSQRDPRAYPKRNTPRPASGRSPMRTPQLESAGQARQPSYPSNMAGSERMPHARSQFGPAESPSGRPRLPHAQETSEARMERTERLRAMRQDFVDHAQTKMTPQKPRNVWLAVVLTAGMLVLCIVGIVAFFQLRTTLFTSGGQDIATQFMDAMQQKNYTAAYSDCSSNVQEVFKDHSSALSKNGFIQQAQAADQLGPITNFTQTGSNSIDSNNMQYTFSVTRKSQTAITVTLGVTKGTDGAWKISSIDGNLLPLAPTPPNSGSGSDIPPTRYPLDLLNSASQTQTIYIGLCRAALWQQPQKNLPPLAYNLPKKACAPGACAPQGAGYANRYSILLRTQCDPNNF
jgi:hypothetical protein